MYADDIVAYGVVVGRAIEYLMADLLLVDFPRPSLEHPVDQIEE
jgi:hypothetical protein